MRSNKSLIQIEDLEDQKTILTFVQSQLILFYLLQP